MKYRTTPTFAIFMVLLTSGKCQLPNFSGMSSLYGSMNPSMSGMFGSMNPSMGLNNFGSAMGMPNMMTMMGSGMNDPLMTLAMGSIELSNFELMQLNSMVKYIVDPGASGNVALMVLYSRDGGNPRTAFKMIPYIAIMQGMAKDLQINVPGVAGKASRKDIEDYIYQRSLQWMQQRNMAGAFNENAGLFLMSNAMNNGGQYSTQSMTSPTSGSPSPSSVNNAAAASARAAASAHASLAKFVASQTDKMAAPDPAAKPSTSAAKPSTSAAKPPSNTVASASSAAAQSSAQSQNDYLASMMAAANQAASVLPAGLTLPARLTLPAGMNMQTGLSMPTGYSVPGAAGGSSTAGSGIMNPFIMANMELMGF